jgi:hypothetical protein
MKSTLQKNESNPEMYIFLETMKRIKERCDSLLHTNLQLEFWEFLPGSKVTHWFGLAEVLEEKRWFRRRPTRRFFMRVVPYFSDNVWHTKQLSYMIFEKVISRIVAEELHEFAGMSGFVIRHADEIEMGVVIRDVSLFERVLGMLGAGWEKHGIIA